VSPGGPAVRSAPTAGSTSFRLRLLASIAALAAAGLAVAGAIAYLVELGRVDSRIAGSLRRAVESVHRYVEEHPDVELSHLVNGAVARSLNAEDECTLGRVGAAGAWTHAGAQRVCGRVLADQRLTVLLGSATGGQSPEAAEAAVRVQYMAGDLGQYAYVAVPIIPAPEDGADAAASAVYAVVIDRGAQRAEVARSYLVGYLPVALGAVALVTAAGWLAAGRILRPLREVAATAAEIASGPGGRPDIGRRVAMDGPGEAVELAGAMNTMLDSLQGAFESQRRLLDDVGHELRTPLTLIQGHLELMDQDDPGDVAATRSLALDELGRMRRLTDSLVTLAAADGPGFAKLAPLDLGPWFAELVEKARGLGDRRWVAEAQDEVWALADPHRLTEAMLELAANAVKHSPAGSTVVFALRREGAWARLAVRDQGGGIDPADHQRIFGRFARASGARRDDGAGLGLAIVAKIAAAHGGRVDLRSTPGAGAEFVLALPAIAAPAPPPEGPGRGGEAAA
ncbi:MAG: HAMP domain-containing histidine kinase, partial [Bifidobacteriaceae bacterium]|jgi:signal transduction histidine kinase|nr:HAMP domain-containing histidine kinase [Bifidobacteriaceae bacterium]